jgi:hypothetical protein
VVTDTYSGAVALAGHERYWWVVLPFCSISFLGAYMQYFGAIKNGFRDRTHSIPLGCNLWFLAHDTTYVSMRDHWFNGVDHWLVKCFWFALVVFACCELVVFSQLFRFSRQALFPGFGKVQTILALLFCQACTYLLFWWFHSLARDPIYLLCFTTTVILTPVLTIPMMLSRGTRQGYSVFMLTGYVLLALGFYPWVYFVEPYFQQPLYLALGVANILVSLIPLWLFFKLPAYQPGFAGAASSRDLSRRLAVTAASVRAASTPTRSSPTHQTR